MRWVDGHLDLAYLAVTGRDMLRPLHDCQAGCVTLPVLRDAGIDLCFGTIFTEPAAVSDGTTFTYSRDDAHQAQAVGMRQLQQYMDWRQAGEISLVRSASDLDSPHRLPAVVLLMENADPIRSPDEVRLWHERGLRIVGLTWATGSRYAGGNASAPGEGPLTSTGRDMVTALDACNIIHDVSHLSDAAFDDLLSLARGPVIASHSNCRSLVEDRQRHLRDDQIIAIAQRGGMIGLNLYSPFLAAGRRATIADCIAHVQHVCDLVGHDHCIGLGSDIDGGFGPDRLPEGLDHPCMLHRLADALADAGWTDEQIYGFAGGNWRAFLRRSLPPS